jgi:hypothetical protein
MMVLQTALHAADIDYRVCVVRDGCFPQYEIEDFGEKAVMEKVLKRRTDVMTMEEFKQDMVTRAIEDRVIDEVQHQNAHGYAAKLEEDIRQDVMSQVGGEYPWMAPFLP